MSDKIEVNVTIHADTNKVWDYYTNPLHITKWNFANEDWECPLAENHLQVGGKYKATMAAKDGSFSFDFEATYLEIKKGKHFIYQMIDGRTVSVQFFGRNSTTDVVILFDAEKVNPVEIQKNGWQAILDNFKKYTESS